MIDLAAGTCRFCGCTDAEACDDGCRWVDTGQTTCSICHFAAGLAGELVAILGVVAAHPTAGIRLSTTTWQELPLEQQRVLVMTCRGVVEGIRDVLLETVRDEGVEAAIELSTIGRFLVERCPEAVAGDTSMSEVVIRLLEPHIGSRIVLP